MERSKERARLDRQRVSRYVPDPRCHDSVDVFPKRGGGLAWHAEHQVGAYPRDLGARRVQRFNRLLAVMQSAKDTEMIVS